MVDFVKKLINDITSKDEQVNLIVEEYNKLKDELFDLENFMFDEENDDFDYDKEMEIIDAKIHSVKLKMKYFKDALIELDSLELIEKKNDTPKIQFTIHNEKIKRRVDEDDEEEYVDEEESEEDEEVEATFNTLLTGDIETARGDFDYSSTSSSPNQITDPTGTCRWGRELGLDNQISDISALKNLTSLKSLYSSICLKSLSSGSSSGTRSCSLGRRCFDLISRSVADISINSLAFSFMIRFPISINGYPIKQINVYKANTFFFLLNKSIK